MRYGPRAAITALALAAIGANPASGTPAPDNILQAHPALRFDPASRCSDVRPAGPDDEPVAVVLFQVGSTGVPSKATVKASSGAADLDAAATNCVLRLRFQPATRMGDGVAIDSWQQMAWKRARVGAATALPQPQPATATASLAPPAAPAGTASAPGTAQIRSPPPTSRWCGRGSPAGCRTCGRRCARPATPTRPGRWWCRTTPHRSRPRPGSVTARASSPARASVAAAS